MTKISTADNDIGNDVVLPRRTPIFLISVIVVLILTLSGFGYLAYYYVNDGILSPKKEDTAINPDSVPKTTTELKNISKTLGEQIGRFVTRVEKKDGGYIITISDYSPVFAYVTRNEKDYIEELSLLFPADTTQTETKPVVATSTTLATATTIATTTIVATTTATATKATKPSTKTATTTKATSTSTQQGTTTPVITVPLEINDSSTEFSDVTLSNQNMRVWKHGGHTVVYAFVGNNTLLIANGTAGILSLKGGILR